MGGYQICIRVQVRETGLAHVIILSIFSEVEFHLNFLCRVLCERAGYFQVFSFGEGIVRIKPGINELTAQ